mmetsp:Transcript_23603/g.56003  ORF Transcript_23603/g.56003 Transcript_23603/m.56003 type:complete len:204 (+) Transcript_23603:21-632(+)
MVSTPPRAITRESRETDETSCKAQCAELVRTGSPLAALAVGTVGELDDDVAFTWPYLVALGHGSNGIAGFNRVAIPDKGAGLARLGLPCHDVDVCDLAVRLKDDVQRCPLDVAWEISDVKLGAWHAAILAAASAAPEVATRPREVEAWVGVGACGVRAEAGIEASLSEITSSLAAVTFASTSWARHTDVDWLGRAFAKLIDIV